MNALYRNIYVPRLPLPADITFTRDRTDPALAARDPTLLFNGDFKVGKVGHVLSSAFAPHLTGATRARAHREMQRRTYARTHVHTEAIDHSRRTQAFDVRVIKHFACEGIIVGVGPARAVYTVLVRRGTARGV